jgi:hypothetical protein
VRLIGGAGAPTASGEFLAHLSKPDDESNAQRAALQQEDVRWSSHDDLSR